MNSASDNRDKAQERSPRLWRDRFFYGSLRYVSRTVGVTCFDLRCLGRCHLAFPGPALLLSTHQSTLDPVLVGLMDNQEMTYLARKTLFNNRLFAALIRALNAIEIDREGGGLMGLKMTLKSLRQGNKVLLFPEGTRTATGRPAELKPGFVSLARRGAVPLVPMAVTGAFHVLQRGKKIPRYAPLCLVVGPPMLPDDVAALDDPGLLAEVKHRMLTCHQQAVEHVARSLGLRYR